jgi:hypothetical protein
MHIEDARLRRLAMESLNWYSNREARWHAYRQLASGSIQQGQDKPLPGLGLATVWRALASILISGVLNELDDEQRVDYLEQCWSLESQPNTNAGAMLRKLWQWLN